MRRGRVAPHLNETSSDTVDTTNLMIIFDLATKNLELSHHLDGGVDIMNISVK